MSVVVHLPHSVSGIEAGLRAALWLIGLWYAAPLFTAAQPSTADRLRVVALLGITAPFILAFAGLFTALALWGVLFALVALRATRLGIHDALPTIGPAEGAAIVALVALAWPVAVRPTMDGDTLIYHLPNAAAWVNAHSVWTTGTRYWWYPPGSELFAAGLWAVAGPPSFGLAGMVPAALLLARLAQVSRESAVPSYVGLAFGVLVIATTAAREQVVSLQNDLWLTSLFVEAMATRDPLTRSALALIKPQGIAFALISLARKEWVRSSTALFAIPFGLWVLRDALLWPSAVVPPSSTAYPGMWSTMILAHLGAAVSLLPSALLAAGPSMVMASIVALAVIVADGRYRIPALSALAVFLVAPFGFESDMPQLASGQSLRFALPLLGLVALAAASSRGLAARAVSILAILAVAADVHVWWKIFENDATTRDVSGAVMIATVLIAGVILLTKRKPRVRLAYPVAFVFALTWSGGLSGTNAEGYLADRFDVRSSRGGVFSWLGERRPRRVLVYGLPAGALNLVLPNAQIGDGIDRAGCVEAKGLDAVLVMTDPVPSCGLVSLYNDGIIGVEKRLVPGESESQH